MALKEMPAQKYREVYSQRRLEDKANFGGELTQPVNNTFDITTGERSRDIEQLPLMTETQLDVGEFLGRLNIKKFDGPVIGQTLHREEILGAIDPLGFGQSGQVVAPQTRSIWGYSSWNAYGTYGGLAPGNTIKNFLNSQDKYTLYTKSNGTSTPRVKTTTGDIAGLSNNDFAQVIVKGSLARNGDSAIQLNPTIPKAWHVSGVSDAQSGHLKHRWAPHKGNNTTSASYLTGKVVENLGVGDGLYPTEFDAYADLGDTAPHNELILDYVSQSLVHSSALSFLYQYRSELESIASQTQYLSSELVGFYEKGLKGDFLRYWSKSEISLMFALVELGAAVRRQALVRNATAPGPEAYMDSESVYLTGTVNPFFMYVDTLKSKNLAGDVTTTSVQRMYTPWWLTMLMDRHYFEYDSAVDDVRDIHREDLFQGIRMVLEAASMEYGMITAATGRPYLDFFEDFMSAGLRDFTVMDDVKTLRSLLMAGYEHAESFNNFGSVQSAGYEYFKDFLQSNRIAETVRLDHQKNMEELDRLSVMTGDMFKLGQQLMGDFEYTDEHRLTRFGSKSVDVRFKPAINWRPLSYQWIFSNSASATAHTFSGLADSVGGATQNVGSLALHDISLTTIPAASRAGLDHTDAADWLTVLNALSTDVRRFTAWIAFPRLTKGLTSLSSAGTLDFADPFCGYGNIRVNTTNSSNVTLSPFTSTATQVPDKYGFMQLVASNLIIDDNFVDTAGTNARRVLLRPVALAAPYHYWNLGDEGLFPGLIRSLNKVYQAWQGRTSGLFRRSELKNLLSFTTYNIARELKMNTPDAYLQKNAKNILGMMGCGGSGFSPGFMVRKVNRKLGDSSVHARSSTGVFGSPGSSDTDVDLLFSPYYGEATEIEDMFFAQHLLGMLCGLYGHDFYSLKLPGYYTVSVLGTVSGVDQLNSEVLLSGAVPYPISGTVETNIMNKVILNDAGTISTEDRRTDFRTTGGKFNMHYSGQREIGFFPINSSCVNRVIPPSMISTKAETSQPLGSALIDGSLDVDWLAKATGSAGSNDSYFIVASMGDHTRYSCMRTFYYYYRALDGDDSRITVTNVIPMGPIHPAFQTQVFNFRTETAGNMSDTNGTTFDLIPGHRSMFLVWKVFGNNPLITAYTFNVPTDFTTGVPSLCTTFGNDAVQSTSGSNVPGLAGFRGAASVNTLLESDTLTSEGFFNNGAWLRYLEKRLGGLASDGNGSKAEPDDLLRWRGAAAGLMVYDQDILDISEGFLGSLLYITFGVVHPGMLTYAATLKSDGDVGYEVRGTYGWGDASANVTEDYMATESSTGDIDPVH